MKRQWKGRKSRLQGGAGKQGRERELKSVKFQKRRTLLEIAPGMSDVLKGGGSKHF